MQEIRKATIDDVARIAEAVMAAEKGSLSPLQEDDGEEINE